MRTLLRIFFGLLYHPFAFAYDLVASIVSFGHWQDWILEVVPFIKGTRTLELGHGPGHLHRFLHSLGLVAVAMDESAQMGRLAQRRLGSTDREKRATKVAPVCLRGYTQTNLTRGLAQHLPFRDGSFDTVIATFPAEYITDARTLAEVGRCLVNGGRFIVLPAAMPENPILSWLFKVTGQASSEAVEVIQEKLKVPFIEAGFVVTTHVLKRNSGTLILLIAEKDENTLYVEEIS